MTRKRFAGLALLFSVALGFGCAGWIAGLNQGIQRQQAAFAASLKTATAQPAPTPAPADLTAAFAERYPDATLQGAWQNTAYVFEAEGRAIVKVGDAWLEIAETPAP